MNTPLLEMRDAALEVAGHSLVSGVSFTLGCGEVLGIAGSNGAGKSSLLRLASAECAPSIGRVCFQGQALEQLAPETRARHLAVLPQSTQLQFDFSVRQVVALGRSPHRDLGGDGEQVIDSVIERCDLGDLAQRSYQSLSGGEKQRTHLARVLAQLTSDIAAHDLTGQCLILDEPTAAMDIRHQEHCLALLTELAGRNCAILLVMHDINLLSRFADRLLFLKAGHMHSLGATRDQLTEDTLSTVFDYPLKIVPADGEQPFWIYPESHDQRT